jgi:hypothetical protein
VHSAPDDPCRETGEIADHAAAKRDDGIAPLEPRCQYAVHDLLPDSIVNAALAALSLR